MLRCCSDNNATESRAAEAAVASLVTGGKEENDSSLEILPENDHVEEFMFCKTFLGPKTGTFHRIGRWKIVHLLK